MEAVLRLPDRTAELGRKLTRGEVSGRLERISSVLPILRSQQNPCRLCPRTCGAPRQGGEAGECGLDDRLLVASVARHIGEEPPISGCSGAINVFFSGCNLHCIHCQNWPISQNRVGRYLSAEDLSTRILRKWRRGAQSLGWVTPTAQIVGALEAYRLCLEEGFDLPLVHNGGGYESSSIIQLLSGIVDIWLPDAKTADTQRSLDVQGVADYPEHNQRAIAAMFEQVENGSARAVIVRHLVLPDGLEDSRLVLTRLWDSFRNRIHLSLMGQYFPTYRTLEHDTLGRELRSEDYDNVIRFAKRLGFWRGWVQQKEVQNGIPLHCLS